MRIRHILVATTLVLMTLSAHALNRIIPSNAKRAQISFAHYPTVLLDGKVCRTSPGLRIYNQRNMTQVNSSLAGYKFEASYTLDAMGQLNRIWILTREEMLRSPHTVFFGVSDEDSDDEDTDSDTDDDTDSDDDSDDDSDSDDDADEE